ncbi:MAG: manganese transporter [Spirochaetaceae bacterium]|nr:MAG: manganese transporter [Spirochaetaceae bacterium]
MAVLAALVLLLAACTGEETQTDQPRSYPISVVATTGMIADIAASVGGDRTNVHPLMGSDIDPHLYRPTRSDVARMQRADIIFYNGLMLEGRMGDTLVQMARTRPVFAVSEAVDESLLLEDDEYEEAFDPHLWMDVSLWMRAVDVVVNALSEFDPDGAAEYRANADAYLAQLEELDAYVHEIMASIPENRRILITAHDAFGYFGDAYGVEVLGVQGISTESEAGLEDVNRLVNYIVENDVRAVFAETTVPDRAMMAIIEGAAARGHRVELGGELYSDAMGAPGSYEGTYIGMIDHNATTVVRALGGTAPERGLHGRLSR